MHLATEEDAAGLFADCEAGAIPPLGPAYARDIGADGYAEDGAAALRLFQRLASGGPAGSPGGMEARRAL